MKLVIHMATLSISIAAVTILLKGGVATGRDPRGVVVSNNATNVTSDGPAKINSFGNPIGADDASQARACASISKAYCTDAESAVAVEAFCSNDRDGLGTLLGHPDVKQVLSEIASLQKVVDQLKGSTDKACETLLGGIFDRHPSAFPKLCDVVVSHKICGAFAAPGGDVGGDDGDGCQCPTTG